MRKFHNTVNKNSENEIDRKIKEDKRFYTSRIKWDYWLVLVLSFLVIIAVSLTLVIIDESFDLEQKYHEYLMDL